MQNLNKLGSFPAPVRECLESEHKKQVSHREKGFHCKDQQQFLVARFNWSIANNKEAERAAIMRLT